MDTGYDSLLGTLAGWVRPVGSKPPREGHGTADTARSLIANIVMLTLLFSDICNNDSREDVKVALLINKNFASTIGLRYSIPR